MCAKHKFFCFVDEVDMVHRFLRVADEVADGAMRVLGN